MDVLIFLCIAWVIAALLYFGIRLYKKSEGKTDWIKKIPLSYRIKGGR